jgi:hypothetical protein
LHFLMGDLVIAESVAVEGRENGESYVWLGRKDNQVKVRGMRVELEAVEAAAKAAMRISDSLDVKMAAVTVEVATSTEETTVLLVLAIETSTRDSHINLREVKALLQEKLPAVMVPHLVLPLLSLPVTTAGKIDRQALRRQVLSTHFEEGSARRESAPASETALRQRGDGFDRARQAVCEVFLQVLPLTSSARRSLESISGMPTIQTSPVLELDFFAAGGDSMTAVVLSSLSYRPHFPLVIDCLA